MSADGVLVTCPAMSVGALQVHATLQRLEACRRIALERDDLAVEHERPLAPLRECAHAGGDLGELVRLVLAVSRDEPNAGAGREGEHADAVVLRLERPPVAGRDLGADRCHHRRDYARKPEVRGREAGLTAPSPRLLGLPVSRFRRQSCSSATPSTSPRDLVHRSPRCDRRVKLARRPSPTTASVIAMLDQEPLRFPLAPARHANERERAAQPLAMQT